MQTHIHSSPWTLRLCCIQRTKHTYTHTHTLWLCKTCEHRSTGNISPSFRWAKLLVESLEYYVCLCCELHGRESFMLPHIRWILLHFVGMSVFDRCRTALFGVRLSVCVVQRWTVVLLLLWQWYMHRSFWGSTRDWSWRNWKLSSWKVVQRMMKTLQHIPGVPLPTNENVQRKRCLQRESSTAKCAFHPWWTLHLHPCS